MAGFTKLFASLIHSTVWREPDYVRLVWITMLAIADRDGVVEASIPGLADAARVTLEQCEQALERLRQPDSYSRTKEHEGRRIEDTEGGWLILNHSKYREQLTLEQMRTKQAERQKRYRERKKLESEKAHEDPATVFDGSASETIIPLDMTDRAELILPDVMSSLPGVTLEQLRAGTNEFVTYWTIGGGAGKRRNFWMRRLRESLRKSYHEKRLTKGERKPRNAADALYARALAAEAEDKRKAAG